MSDIAVGVISGFGTFSYVLGLQALFDHIKKSGINIRVASLDERTRMRNMMFEDAKKAYIERAGDVGKSLMSLYASEYAKLNN